jgi:hypothetical protein
MKKSFREGFTLVELALSMAFVGILSVSVVLIISDTVASYRRGLTLTQVNATGMEIVDDMRLAVTNSSAQAVSEYCARYYNKKSEIVARNNCEKDGAYSFVTLVKRSTVELKEGSEVKTYPNVPIYGAFCTGTFSYIWNSGYYDMEGASFQEKTDKKWAKLYYTEDRGVSLKKTHVVGSLVKNADFNKFDDRGAIVAGWDGEDAKPFRLLKIRDTSRAVCRSMSRGTDGLDEDDGKIHNYLSQEELDGPVYGGIGNVFDITNLGAIDKFYRPEDLIMTNKDNDLALFDLYVARPSESTSQRNMLYSVSFILGTVGGGANIMENGKSCKTPADYENEFENFDYCAINKFNFAMQAGGE